MFESGFVALRAGNTYSPPAERAVARSRISRHRGDRGTRCLTPAFIRLPGIVHVCESNSISSHVARKISPVLAAQRIMNSNASLTLSLASEPWSARRNAGNLLIRKSRMMFLATPVPRENLGQALCGVVPSTVALGLAPVEDDAQTLEDHALEGLKRPHFRFWSLISIFECHVCAKGGGAGAAWIGGNLRKRPKR